MNGASESSPGGGRRRQGRRRCDRRRFDRRGFLQGSLAAVAAARVPRLVRPSDEWRVAVVGLNGRGAEHVAALQALEGVRVVALCDVDDHVLAREARKLRQRDRPADPHGDLRTVLARADVDGVVLATPDHWHALQALWALQAGKDVFLEMPATHFFAEGARVVAAAERHGRVVGCNLPARASPALREAIAWTRAGNLGTLEHVRGLHHEPQPSIGDVKGNQRIPDHVNYDLWCGPAPLQPLRRANLHRDWQWQFATGNGALARGAPALDLALWLLGAETLPSSVTSLGTRAGYVDDGETPNTQLVFYAFEPAPLLFDVRGLPRDAAARAGDWNEAMDDHLGVKTGVVAVCAGGTLRVPSAASAIACDPEGREIRRWEAPGDALASWVDACRNRDTAELAAGLAAGTRASALVHLGNASHRVGRALAQEPMLAELGSSALLTRAAEQLLAHLAANQVDLLEHKPVLGPCLLLDHASASFLENVRASALLAGRYREPYVLPESA